MLLDNIELNCFLNSLVQCLRALPRLEEALTHGLAYDEQYDEPTSTELLTLLRATGPSSTHSLRCAIASGIDAPRRDVFLTEENCINDTLGDLFGRLPETVKNLFTFDMRTSYRCANGCPVRVSC